MSGIIRAPRPERGWTEIQNSTLRDSRLSFRARGVLARLLSNADGFRMTAVELAGESPQEGRQAVLTALRELREAGYIVQRRLQGERGQWRTETYVYDTPQESTATEVRLPDLGSTEVRSPDVGVPDVGSPDRIRKNTEKEQKKEHIHEQVTPPQRERGGEAPPRGTAKPSPYPPLSVPGGRGNKYVFDKATGICLQANNPDDDRAMTEIKRHAQAEIVRAVQAAAADDPRGRAYPTAVLRRLRRPDGRPDGKTDAAPAWARLFAGSAPQAQQEREIDITDWSQA